MVEYEGKRYELQMLNDLKVNECIAAKDYNQTVMVYYANGQMYAGAYSDYKKAEAKNIL